MRLYLASLGAGMLVGVIYSLINVRSPAPPVVALVRLLGILVGEQVIPVGKQLLAGTPLRMASVAMRSARFRRITRAPCQANGTAASQPFVGIRS
jgi:XapX domain-containing protein